MVPPLTIIMGRARDGDYSVQLLGGLKAQSGPLVLLVLMNCWLDGGGLSSLVVLKT